LIRTLIVDDEPVARAGLRALLSEDPEIEIIGECGNGADTLRMIEDAQPDLVLLDVQMPELDGFGVLRALPRDNWPAVIFVTAFDRYALHAFDHNAVDYLLKPFGDERAREAIARAKQRIRGTARAADRERVSAMLAGTGYLRRLAYRERERVAFLAVESIDWIEAEGDYVRIHAGAHAPLIRARLRDLSEQLDPAIFLRVHRSILVNIDRVRELRPASHGDYQALLEDGTRIKVSRTYRDELARRTGNYF
jgi:two-component system LytT family response regulator